MRNNEKRLGQGLPGPQPNDGPAAHQQAAPLAFVVPTEFVELPSRGIFYPSGHPLHGEETIEIKFMTAKEEDILTSATLIKKGIVLERLIDNLILDVRIKATDLFVGDRNAIMVAARKSAYGRSYETKISCPSCGKESEEEYDLNDVEYTGQCFDEDFLNNKKITIDNQAGIFQVDLPKSNVTVGLRLLTGRDELNLAQAKKQKTEETIVTDTLMSVIATVAGSSDKFAIKNFVYTMPAMDSKFIRNIYAELVPNIEFKRAFACLECYLVTDLEVPFTAAFFWPE